MGFFKKLFGTAAVTGAAIGGALYVKNRKETRNNSANSEDFDDEKIFDVNKDSDKVTITFNSKKAKNVADQIADKVIDVTDSAKNTVAEKIGDENVEKIKDTMDAAKDKINDAADTASSLARDAKDKVVEKIGEDNVNIAKARFLDAVDDAKEVINDKVDKYVKPIISKDDESDFVDEDDIQSFVASNNSDDSIEETLSDKIDEAPVASTEVIDEELPDELDDDIPEDAEDVVPEASSSAESSEPIENTSSVETEDDVTMEDDFLDTELDEL